MSILGLFTSSGISKTIDAQNNEGFKIYPESFSISRQTGSLDVSRTTQNSGTWFTAAISSRNVIDSNTVKFICTIPPESALVVEDVKEICLFAKDSNGVDFLLAVGQPSEEILYDPTGTVTLELQISLADVDLTSIYVFNNTKAVEIEEHATDPNAHPEIMELLSKYGIALDAGGYAQERMGQPIEFPVEFEGTKATFSHDGVVWSAKYNGNELNSEVIVFDGLKSNDEIRADFNALNYPNTVEHNGSGSAVSVAATKTFVGGTYSLVEKDIVYKDVDNVYKRAYADGSSKSRLVGAARLSKKMVVGPGFVDINTGLVAGTPLYLSGTTAGKITNFNTNISIGVSLGDHIFFTGYAGDASTSVAQEFDAVVTDAAGVGQFATTQQAIDFVPNNGRILINKQELIKATLDTKNKNLTIVSGTADTGWKRFLGQSTIFTLTFDDAPTQGTFRIEWENQETNDMPWNASASLVETEFNQLSGHNGFTVTGNFVDGFTFQSNDLQVYTLPTFIYAGRNEIQKFNFSAVPDNGTVRFSFNGQETTNHAYNDTVEQLQTAFSNISSIINCEVTGSFALGYTIEFKGGWLEDGNKEQNLIEAVTNYLFLNGVNVEINGEDDVEIPTDAIVLQKGKTPAANLYNGTSLINIATTMVQLGEEVGPDRLMDVDSPVLRIEGMGLIEDFREGFVLKNANTILTLQARTLMVDKPVMSIDKLPTVNYDIEMPDFAKDVVAELRLTEHPTLPKRAKVSGIDFKLPSGITLVKSLDNLKAKFIGAEIDFAAGKIYDSEGTDIGIDFIVPVITPTMWKWYSVNLIISGSDAGLNIATANILILAATGEGTTKELAPQAPVDDYPIGLVALRGALGEKEKTVITTVKDNFAHRLAGKTFILHHPLESVAFYFDEPSLAGNPTTLALTADRFVKMETLVLNDFQATVAQKITAYIDADTRFTASVVGNKVTVENADLGDVPNADMGDTQFFADVIQEGTETDASGIDDIKNENIMQFSTGSGSGAGGVGIGDLFIADLDYELKDSYFGYMDSNVFPKNKEKKLSVQGGRYVTTKKHWELDAGQSIVSTDHLDDDFKESLNDLEKIAITLNYALDAQDPNPVVEVSRDGGVNFQVVTMDDDNSGLRHGKHEFITEPSLAVVNEYAVANENDSEVLGSLNTKFSQEFTTSLNDTVVFKKLTSYLNKLGSPVGTVTVLIVKDNAFGEPSQLDTDIVWMSSPVSISSLAAGAVEVVHEVHGCVLTPNTLYHLVYVTDAGYKANYVAGVNEIAVRGDNSPSTAFGQVFDETDWLASDMAAVFKLEGRVLDLRVKITSSVNDSGIIGYGIFYAEESLPSVSDFRAVEIHHFSGSLNKDSFLLTEFVPNPDFLEVCLVQTGQLWKYPAFEIQGQTIKFPENSFNIPSETLTLRFDQTKGGTYDNSDRNLNLLTENHLGSQDVGLDKSAPGRGIFLRRPDGTLREICIDDSDNIIVYSV